MILVVPTVLIVALGLLSGCSQELAAARALEQAGDLDGAIGTYESIMAEYPSDIDALRGAAALLWMAQRYDEALPYQERLVLLDEHEAQVRVELGFNYLNHQSRANDAARVLREAAELEPTARNWTFAGQALREAGDLSTAEIALRHAIENDEGYARAHEELARLLDSVGRGAEAIAVRAQAPTAED